MKSARELKIEQSQDLNWHYQNCDIDMDNGRYYDLTHEIEVTDCVPDYEPDPYDNFQENELIHG